MSELKADDEITLIASIEIRYSAVRGDYSETPTSLADDAMMAWIDKEQYDSGAVSLGDITSWSDGKQNVTVQIRPEGSS